MPRGKKNYKPGDQIHFIVTEDFAETANDFKIYCESNSINTSAAMRNAIAEWLRNKSQEDAYIKQMEVLAVKKVVVEQAFLIYKDGALLAHATSHIIPDMDMDIFSSMLTAIQNFIKESFKDEMDANLSRLEFGEKKISLARPSTSHFHVALVYSGNDRRADVISGLIIQEIELQYGETLTNWDGNLNKLRGSRDILIEHIT